jgi:hypothetical protein
VIVAPIKTVVTITIKIVNITLQIRTKMPKTKKRKVIFVTDQGVDVYKLFEIKKIEHKNHTITIEYSENSEAPDGVFTVEIKDKKGVIIHCIGEGFSVSLRQMIDRAKEFVNDSIEISWSNE